MFCIIEYDIRCRWIVQWCVKIDKVTFLCVKMTFFSTIDANVLSTWLKKKKKKRTLAIGTTLLRCAPIFTWKQGLVQKTWIPNYKKENKEPFKAEREFFSFQKLTLIGWMTVLLQNLTRPYPTLKTLNSSEFHEVRWHF